MHALHTWHFLKVYVFALVRWSAPRKRNPNTPLVFLKFHSAPLITASIAHLTRFESSYYYNVTTLVWCPVPAGRDIQNRRFCSWKEGTIRTKASAGLNLVSYMHIELLCGMWSMRNTYAHAWAWLHWCAGPPCYAACFSKSCPLAVDAGSTYVRGMRGSAAKCQNGGHEKKA